MPQRGRRVPPPAPPQPRAAGGPAIILVPARPASEGPIDLSQPRVCYYRAFDDRPGACPRCGGTLEQRYVSYLISTGEPGQAADSFVSGSKAGWFCAQCPAVVIDTNAIGELLSLRLPHWNVGQHFAVLGIVDLKAVPEERKRLPLGRDDNPIPLIAFEYESGEAR